MASTARMDTLLQGLAQRKQAGMAKHGVNVHQAACLADASWCMHASHSSCVHAEADKRALEKRKAEVEASIAAAKQEVPRAQQMTADAQAMALALAAEARDACFSCRVLSPLDCMTRGRHLTSYIPTNARRHSSLRNHMQAHLVTILWNLILQLCRGVSWRLSWRRAQQSTGQSAQRWLSCSTGWPS